MTVAQLIKELLECDQESEIQLHVFDGKNDIVTDSDKIEVEENDTVVLYGVQN